MSQVAVAVLTQPGAAADQLRDALDHAGAEVVWEGPPDQLDLAELPGDVVVINLDPDTEAQLPTIESLLVDGTVRVVFNDATVSSSLSGWDLQRWARHLAAKVLDSTESAELPSAPPGAEPLAIPPVDPTLNVEADMLPVHLRVSGREYIEDVISAEIGEPPLPYQNPDSVAEGPAAVVAPPAAERVALTLEDMDEPESAVEATSPDPFLQAGTGAEPVEPVPAAELPATDEDTFLGGLSLEPMSSPDDAESTPVDRDAGQTSSGLMFTDDLDLITAEVDEATLPDEFQALDAGPDAGSPSAAGAEADAFGFGELTLEPLELPEGNDAFDATASERTPSAAPEPSPTAAPVAAAPSAFAMQEDAQDGAKPGSAGAPRQLWIVAGALGAPEAVAQFFNALPQNVEAAFLVVTHFERGNAESLARSLGSSGKRRVGVAGESGRLASGDVIVAPDGVRVLVSRDGDVSVEALDNPAGVIDQCARAAADSFGMDAGIIVFSGGARDGFEGALYLAQRGGVVWAQDPATCVAGAMAETIRARGLATYIGSPRGLAEHFVQEFC